MRSIFCRVNWAHCKHSTSSFWGTVSVSVAGLFMSHMDKLSVWPYSGKGPGEPEGAHSYLNPPHTTNAVLHGLSLPLLSSSYTYPTISKMRIANSHHLNSILQSGKLQQILFVQAVIKMQPLLQQNCSYFMCHFHILVLFPLSVIYSAGEKSYKFPVPSPSSFCPWKLRAALSEVVLPGINTGAAPPAPGSAGSNEMALTW